MHFYFRATILFVCILLINGGSFAQMSDAVDSFTVNKVLTKSEKKFPKFYREFNYIKANDTLIKNIIFVEPKKSLDNGPAKAGPKGNIFIDIKYLEHEQPDFDDDRLVVVLYHEIGHLHYFMTVPVADRDPEENEKYAFEYSLTKTKELADKGDCKPLKVGLKFMKIRSESDNLQDPHVRALKKMLNEQQYSSYMEYVKLQCK
ncbi:MAG: hypothetical protein JWN76_3228 [Chitinophagaceae bacterium]|nr:hypothetical protein [Chitinophagaceae bacterium]